MNPPLQPPGQTAENLVVKRVTAMMRTAGVVMLAVTASWACSSAQASRPHPPRDLEAQLYDSAGPAAVVTLDTLKRRIEQRRGHVVVLHLWASWCEPCLRELPMIAELARDMQDRGLEVFSVSVDQVNRRNAQRVGQIISQHGGTTLTRAIVQIDDPDAFVAAIDPRWRGTIPALFAFGRDGALAATLVGESRRERVESVLQNLVTPP